MNEQKRRLIGPGLLLAICQKEDWAVQWGDNTPLGRCIISTLAVSIAKSVVMQQAIGAVQHKWILQIDRTISTLAADGVEVIGVSNDTIVRFIPWRSEPDLMHTAINADESQEQWPIGHDTRLLIATADAMGLVFCEIDDTYMRVIETRGIAVERL